MVDTPLQQTATERAQALGQPFWEKALRPDAPWRDAVGRGARGAASVVGRRANSALTYGRSQIKTHPVAATTTVFAAGVLLGALLAPLARMR